MAEKRSTFEDVGKKPDAVPQPLGGMIDAVKRGRNPVRRWLAALFVLVALMIAVGGPIGFVERGQRRIVV